MPNPFNVQQPNNIQQAYRMLANSKNPMQVFEYLAAQNPRMQPVMQALKGGANPQSLFYSICQSRGINPTEFLKNVTG